jgi:hypothetical protein
MKKLATILLFLFIVPIVFAKDISGRFAAGTPYEEPAAHATANVSRMFVRAVPRASAVDLPATGESSMIIWTIPARPKSKVRTRLHTPNGAVLQPSDRGSLERGLRRFEISAAETAELGIPGGAHEVVHVLASVPARYQLDVDADATVIAAEPDSTLTLSTWAAPLSRQPGQPITLHAELRAAEGGIRGATVTARLASPSGRAFDVVALTDQGDGVYSATINDLPDRAAGAWQVRFEAEGVSTKGVRFARTGSGELVAERGAARLGTIRTEVVDDVLRVTVPAEMFIAGTYRLDVLVADDARNAVAWAEGVRTLNAGAASLHIDIPLAHLGTTSLDALRLDVRLLGLDAIGVAGRSTLNLE